MILMDSLILSSWYLFLSMLVMYTSSIGQPSEHHTWLIDLNNVNVAKKIAFNIEGYYVLKFFHHMFPSPMEIGRGTRLPIKMILDLLECNKFCCMFNFFNLLFIWLHWSNFLHKKIFNIFYSRKFKVDQIEKHSIMIVLTSLLLSYVPYIGC
jgi:hypothetical protein